MPTQKALRQDLLVDVMCSLVLDLQPISGQRTHILFKDNRQQLLPVKSHLLPVRREKSLPGHVWEEKGEFEGECVQAVCRAFLKGSFKQSLTFRLRNMFSPWGVTFRSRMGWLINIPDYIHSNKYPLLSSHPEMPGIYPKATATVPEILGTLWRIFLKSMPHYLE